MKRQEVFYNHPKHLVAVDCVIFGYEMDDLKLLLCPRSFEPARGKWSLMGGFVQEKESLEDAARRVLYQTTGLKDISLNQVAAFSKFDRDPVDRVISITFVALIRIDKHDSDMARESGAHWWPIRIIPSLIFDHNIMVDKALKSLQSRASNELVGRELLPGKFTLLQLRNLYEAIFMKPFDPGNFRKKVLSLNVIERMNIKNKEGSKKGAYYYRFKDEVDLMNNNKIFKIH